MAERLTKHGKTTHENGICCTHFSGEECVKLQGDCSNGCLWEEKVWEKLAHYEDLEEQGKLIKLPCKIGDTVWDIKWWDDTTETRVIDGKTYFRRVMKHKVTKSKFKLFDYDNFGKTVFLTRKEAEAALKEVDK